MNCHSGNKDSVSSKYKNVILLGDFNLRNLIKQPTCFKNVDNPSCIDLLLSNKPLSFNTSFVIEIELSVFHKKIVAMMKMHFPKINPRVISCRKYKLFQSKTFINSFKKERYSHAN